MKILHVVSAMDPSAGGVTKAVTTIVAGLEGRGEQNEIVCLDPPEKDYIKGSQFRIHALGPAKTSWSYSPRLLPWLEKNLSDYDIVILHGLWQYQGYALNKAIRKLRHKKPKLFIMPHGMLDPYFQKTPERRLKALRNRLFWQFSERHVVNNADCLLFTCKAEEILSFEPFNPYRPKRTEVPGLGIQAPPAETTAMFNAFKEKCGRTDVKGCLLYISRIHPKKGIDMLISAYRELKQEGYALPVLVIAGPGTETDFGNKMKRLAGDARDIIFTGMLAGDAKWGAFYSCSVMILPSHQENFGFVVAEALACSKPVLISNQVNIWREIEAGRGGIVRDDTPEGTRKLLLEWIGLTDSQQVEMGTRSRETYETYFSLAEATRKLSEIINDFCRN